MSLGLLGGVLYVAIVHQAGDLDKIPQFAILQATQCCMEIEWSSLLQQGQNGSRYSLKWAYSLWLRILEVTREYWGLLEYTRDY